MTIATEALRRVRAVLRPMKYGVLSALEKLLGSRVLEWSWRWRHVLSPRVAEDHWASIAHPHRRPLIDSILAERPVDSVLELGCNSGPNLFLLSQDLPAARLSGMDINPAAIAYGRERLREARVTNVQLSVASLDDLAGVGDRSADVVLTDAVLMYVGPDKIGRTLAALTRIAKRRIVLNEWQMPKANGVSAGAHLYHYGHWVHDFEALLRNDPRTADVSVTRIPPEIWNSAGWTEFGARIEVNLRD
jgi:SAM-dependent methyltransferase